MAPLDVLRASDRELSQRASPAQKLAQALEMMSLGIRLKRSALRLHFPGAPEEEIQRMLTAWLTEND